MFREVRGAPAPDPLAAQEAISRLLARRACERRLDQTLNRLSNPQLGWPMAYALSWIMVAGGDSVMPPWVRAQFREASLIVRHLRDANCKSPDCAWCSEKNDPLRALSRWFGFDAFRAEPVDDMGCPLQERIVDETMRGSSVLGILPTGTGKSVCYQIPALSKFDKTGALTVVISPLVALMADQVQGMARAGISSAVTVNGMLSMPERQDALDRVRMGEAAMLLISPEQLRSNSVRSVLAQREIGLWVLDEAHCVSKWGHDFRPDYRFVSRFIKESSGDEAPAQVLCLTATAKPEVVRDIRDHFKSRLGRELLLLDGGAVRTNLSFEVRATQRGTKLADILDVIETKLPQVAPVRAYAETLGIPVEMANESLPSIWRLREMQQFIDVLRRDNTRLLGVRDLVDVLNAIPSNRWTDLIGEGIAALAKELANKAMPVPDLVEWFAEWTNDARGDQRGLLLLTAHRAKGLEFDDVVILNGGWDRPSKDEDPDAPRRLFYVAMTRARRSLAIIGEGHHPFVPDGEEHVLRRAAPDISDAADFPAALYQVPNLKTVDLSWAGRLGPGHPSLTAISAAKAGDPLKVVRDGSNWMMRDSPGASAWTHGQKLVASRGSQLPPRRGRCHRALAQGRQPGRVPGAPSPRCLGGDRAGARLRTRDQA